MRNKTKIKARGWVGKYVDGQLGWFLSKFVSNNYGSTLHFNDNDKPFVKGEEFYRCEITVKLVKNKNGKFIKKVVK